MKTRIILKYSLPLLIAAQAMFLSGCTASLWEKERFAQYHGPAARANLNLFYSEEKKDILVQYDEERENVETVRRRAYWLERNSNAIYRGAHPKFESDQPTHTLVPIPLFAEPAAAPTDTYHGLYAIASTNGQSFSLYTGRAVPQDYSLPAYYAAPGQRVKQVLLTPLALTVDATIVGAVVAVLIASHEADHYSDPHHHYHYH